MAVVPGSSFYAGRGGGQSSVRFNFATSAPILDRILARMAEAASRSAAFAPQILRARENLKTALRLKLHAGSLSSEQIAAIAKALDDAATQIEAV